MKKILIIGILWVSGLFMFSQNMTEVRQMRYEAIGVFDKYSTLILNLENPNIYTKDYFTALFEENANIYNDILPDNSPQEIAVGEYYERYINLIKSSPEISNLEIGFPYFNNGKWNVVVKFRKKFNVKYRKNDLSYPEWAFNYEMLVSCQF